MFLWFSFIEQRSEKEKKSTDESNFSVDTLIGSGIYRDYEYYTVRNIVQCEDYQFCVMQSEKRRASYTGLCPNCKQKHHEIPAQRGFYVLTDRIQSIIAEERRSDTSERRLTVLPVQQFGEICLGRNKGIVGRSNSCYMDSTIYCMFSSTTGFDHLLTMDIDPRLRYLQKILRDDIVNPLRDPKKGLVSCKYSNK